MDGNWERVSYGKKGKEKLTKTEKRKMKENMPTLQSLDPVARSSVYNPHDSDEDEDFLTQYNGAEQQQQQPMQQRNAASGDKKQKVKKSAGSNREVLQTLPVSRVQQAYSQSKATIPDSPLAWLIDICAFIDLQLNFDKKDEWNYSDTEFPSNWLNNACRKFIAEQLQSVSDDVKWKLLLHGSKRLAEQSERRQCCLGTRSVLQLAAASAPQAACDRQLAGKLATALQLARSSPPALTATVWTVSQCGYIDAAVGLCVTARCLLPLLHHKSASGSVLQLLDDFSTTASRQQPTEQSAKFATAELAATLASAAVDASLSAPCRASVSRSLLRLRPLLLSSLSTATATSEPDAAGRLYDAAAAAADAGAGADAETKELLTSLLLATLRARPQQLAEVAGRALRRRRDARRQPDAEVVELVLGSSSSSSSGGWRRSSSPFDAKARTEFARRLLPIADSLPPSAAKLLRRSCGLGAGGDVGGGGEASGAGGFVGAFCRSLGFGVACCVIACCLLLLLATVPQSRLPTFVRPAHQYLEDQQILYHTRRLQAEWRRQLHTVVLPFASKRLEDLSQLYHSRVVPLCRDAASRAQQLYADTLAPRLTHVWQSAKHVYFLHLHPTLLPAAVWLRDSAAWVVASVESEMHAYMPDLAERLGAAANGCLSAVASALHYCSGVLKSAAGSLVG